jgi:2-succinyl-5-enolpyruvyl-6-hydroxy-3-cyclohexene-1-carboxylate synthase
LDQLAIDGVPTITVDPWWQWVDPGRQTSEVVVADPSKWCRAMTHAVEESPGWWMERWRVAEDAAQGAIDRWCSTRTSVTEVGVARALSGGLPSSTTVVVSSSMPVRDLEWFGSVGSGPPRVLSNRGANGIDGVVSTALGVAAGGEGPVVALVGDLAFLHDLSALVNSGESCTVVVVDNGGGGIFSFLDQASSLPPDLFETFFGTPPRGDVADIARGMGIAVVEAETLSEVVEEVATGLQLDGLRVLRVRVGDRQANVVQHGELNSEIAAAVDRALYGGGDEDLMGEVGSE